MDIDEETDIRPFMAELRDSRIIAHTEPQNTDDGQPARATKRYATEEKTETDLARKFSDECKMSSRSKSKSPGISSVARSCSSVSSKGKSKSTYSGSRGSKDSLYVDEFAPIRVLESDTKAEIILGQYPRNLRRRSNDRPIYKLSLGLAAMYKTPSRQHPILDISRPLLRPKCVRQKDLDDEDSNYIIRAGEVVNNRYMLHRLIGKGCFAEVASATDNFTGEEVAIKLIRGLKPLFDQAQNEVELLASMSREAGKNHIVQLYDNFIHRGHQCLVFEKLSFSLYDLLRKIQFRGISLDFIQDVSRQLLISLRYLRYPHIGVIHCDLKPENILFVEPNSRDVRVVDFGSSCKATHCEFTYIQSRSYRAPEVILGLPYSYSIDMWSLGCILVELHTGETLFQSSDILDQLNKTQQLLGRIPSSMIDSLGYDTQSEYFCRIVVQGEESWFLRRGNSNVSDPGHPEGMDLSELSDPRYVLTEKIMMHCYKSQAFMGGNKAQQQRLFHCIGLFVDLIARMLVYDPSKRITPEHALLHPFFTSTMES